MNIIRTKVVELNTIPAVAYKLKLRHGGSGVKIHREDMEETAFAELCTRTGGIVFNPNPKLFPDAAFDEALDLLIGLPYSCRGKVKIVISNELEEEEVGFDETDKQTPRPTAVCMVESDEFKSIIDRYSDEKGKLNYAVMNKQFIQFAQSSSVVEEMCANRAVERDIILFILKNRAAFLAGKKEHLSDDEAIALLDALNEINPRSAFKELALYLRRRLAL